MKIAVVGGGSTYTPELVAGLLARTDVLPVRALWLMDASEERLRVVGGFIQRMVAAAGAPFAVHTTTDLAAAVDGAQYVVTQVRVGGMEARRADEYLGQRWGLVGQETTGVGGMAKALRTIPVILEVARAMAQRAPGALLLNFTNPAGLVTEAVARHAPGVPVVGVCNGPFGIQRNLLSILQRRRGVPTEGRAAFMDILGINHLSWSRGMTLDGEDVWGAVMDAYMDELRDGGNGHIPFDEATIAALHMVPSAYLQYYYDTARRVQAQAAWPPSRAEAVMAVEDDLLAHYADPAQTAPPPGLMKRGGAYYSTVATQMIHAHASDLGEVHVANVPHQGAVDGWPADWVLEMPCRVDARGVVPLPTAPLPPECYGLMAHAKAYELLTVQAAVTGDRRAAHLALLAHPLGPAGRDVPALLDDLLTTHRAHLPQFFPQAAPA